jgi:hypothetical protein
MHSFFYWINLIIYDDDDDDELRSDLDQFMVDSLLRRWALIKNKAHYISYFLDPRYVDIKKKN